MAKKDTTISEYNKGIYKSVKYFYGDEFDLSEGEFASKITSSEEYAKGIYGIIKHFYKDEFDLSEGEFYNKTGLKKKEPSSQDSGISSVESDSEAQSTLENNDLENSDAVLARNYEDVVDNYTRLNNLKGTEFYQSEGESQKIRDIQAAIPFTKDEGERKQLQEQLSAMYEKNQVVRVDGEYIGIDDFNERIQSSKNKYDRLRKEAVSRADKKADELIEKYGEDYFKTETTEEFKVVDNSKASEIATSVTNKYGVSDEGNYWRLLKSTIADKIEYKIKAPKIEEGVEKRFKEKYGLTREKYFNNKQQATLNDVQWSVEKNSERILKDVEDSAKEEVDNETLRISSDLQTITNVYKEDQKKITSEIEALNNKFKNGQINRQYYESQYQNLKGNLDDRYKEYKNNFDKTKAEALQVQNSINTKYDRVYQERMQGVIDEANSKLKGSNILSVDNDVLTDLKRMYKEAYGEAIEGDVEKQKNYRTILSVRPGGNATIFYRTFINSLGNTVSGIGKSVNSKNIEVFGETMTEIYNPYRKEDKSWYDMLNPAEIMANAGEMAGSMLPSMIGAMLGSAVTGGLGAPASMQLLTSGTLSFLGETSSMGGNMYRDVFEETKDPIEAKKKANKLIESQLFLFPTYMFEGLPFIKDGLSFIKPLSLRVAAGGGIEWAQESLLQEIPQQEFEMAIKNNEPLGTALNNINAKKAKNAIIATSGSFAFGGGGQLVQAVTEKSDAAKFISANKIKEKLAKYSSGKRKQFIYNISKNEGKDFALTMLTTLMANGSIDKATLNEGLSILGEQEQISATAKEAGLDEQMEQLYAALKLKQTALREKRGNQNERSVAEKYKKQGEEVDEQIDKVINGEKPNVVFVRYADNDVDVMLHSEFQQAMKKKDFSSAYNNKEITVSFIGELNEESEAAVNAEFRRAKEEAEAEETIDGVSYEIDGKPFANKEDFLNEVRQTTGNPEINVKGDPETETEALNILAGERTNQLESERPVQDTGDGRTDRQATGESETTGGQTQEGDGVIEIEDPDKGYTFTYEDESEIPKVLRNVNPISESEVQYKRFGKKKRITRTYRGQDLIDAGLAKLKTQENAEETGQMRQEGEQKATKEQGVGDMQEQPQEEAQEEVIPEELKGKEEITSLSEYGDIVNVSIRKSVNKIKASVTIRTPSGREITVNRDVDVSPIPQKPRKKSLERQAKLKGLTTDEEVRNFGREKIREYNEATQKALGDLNGVVFKTKKGGFYSVNNGQAYSMNTNGEWVRSPFNMDNADSRSIFMQMLRASEIVEESEVAAESADRRGKKDKQKEVEKESIAAGLESVMKKITKGIKDFKVMAGIATASSQTVNDAVQGGLNAMETYLTTNGFDSIDLATKAAMDAFKSSDWYKYSEKPKTVSMLAERIYRKRFRAGRNQYIKTKGVDHKKHIKTIRAAVKKLRGKIKEGKDEVRNLLKNAEEVLAILDDSELSTEEKNQKINNMLAEAMTNSMDGENTVDATNKIRVIDELSNFEGLTGDEATEIIEYFNKIVNGFKIEARSKYEKHRATVEKNTDELVEAFQISDEEAEAGELNEKTKKTFYRKLKKRFKEFWSGRKDREKTEKNLYRTVREFMSKYDYNLATLLEYMDVGGNNIRERITDMIQDKYDKEVQEKHRDREEWLSLFAESYSLPESTVSEKIERLNEIQRVRRESDVKISAEEYDLIKDIREELSNIELKFYDVKVALNDEVVVVKGKELTLNEGISLIKLWEQPDSRATLEDPEGMNITEDDITKVREAIGEVDSFIMDFVSAMDAVIEKKGDRAAEIFVKITGREMPRPENYFPITRDVNDPLGLAEFEGDIKPTTNIGASVQTFLSKRFSDRKKNKTRIALTPKKVSSGAEIQVGYFDVMDRYFTDINHFLHFSELSQQMNDFVKNKKTILAAKNALGGTGHNNVVYLMRSALNQHHLNLSNIESMDKTTRALKTFINTTLASVLKLKPKMLFMQAGSFIMAQPVAEMNYAEFNAKAAQLVANPAAYLKLKRELMADIPLFRDRIENININSPDLMSSLYTGSGFGLRRNSKSRGSAGYVTERTVDWINKKGGVFMAEGDAAGIVLGYGIAYRKLKEKYGKAEAQRRFLQYESTQQARTNLWLTKGQLQRRYSKDIGTYLWTTVFTSFQSTNKLYLNKQKQSSIRIRRDWNKGGWKNVKRKDLNEYLHARLMGNISYVLMSNLTAIAEFLITGDDEDLDKVKRDLWMYATMGNAATITFMGDLYEMSYNAAYDYVIGNNEGDDLSDAAYKAATETINQRGHFGVDVTRNTRKWTLDGLKSLKEKEYLEAMKPLIFLLSAAKGIPMETITEGMYKEGLRKMYNEYPGVSPIKDKEFREGAYSVLGFSTFITEGGRSKDDKKGGRKAPSGR